MREDCNGVYFNGEEISSIPENDGNGKVYVSLSEAMTKLGGTHETFFRPSGGSRVHQALVKKTNYSNEAISAYFYYQDETMYAAMSPGQSTTSYFDSIDNISVVKSGTNWVGGNNKAIDFYVDYAYFRTLMQSIGIAIDDSPGGNTCDSCQSGEEPLDNEHRFAYNWQNYSAHVTTEFKNKLVEICDRLGIEPDSLLTVMAHESGINPTATNPSNFSNIENVTAIGLIQFTQICIDDINMYLPGNIALTKTALYNMTAVQQLEYVEKAFIRYNQCAAPRQITTFDDTLIAPFHIGGIGRSNDFVLYTYPEAGYTWNSGFDLPPKDGIITRGEVITQYNGVINELNNFYHK